MHLQVVSIILNALGPDGTHIAHVLCRVTINIIYRSIVLRWEGGAVSRRVQQLRFPAHMQDTITNMIKCVASDLKQESRPAVGKCRVAILAVP